MPYSVQAIFQDDNDYRCRSLEYRGFLVMRDDVITTRSRHRTAEISAELKTLKVDYRIFHIEGKLDPATVDEIGRQLQKLL